MACLTSKIIPVSAVNNTQRVWVLQTHENMSLNTPSFTGKRLPTVSSVYSYLILHCADTQCGTFKPNGKTFPL